MKDNTELKQLAKNVLGNYDIVPNELNIIQDSGLKTLWKFTYNHQVQCLKRLKHTKDKAMFTVNAQIYIYEQGGKVPKIYLNNTKEPITEYNDQLFVLYEWIDSKDLYFDNSSDLCSALEGLSKFHVTSKGYVPPQEAKISSKLGRWNEQYESMKNRMLKWKNEAQLKPQNKSYASYLKYIDPIIKIADKAINDLDKSAYYSLTNVDQKEAPLCHQDFGTGNVILSGEDVYIIDLDGVTYDLVGRDLRKIIGKRMEKQGKWDRETIKNILKCYEKGNRLTQHEKEILKIDLLFPHWFFAKVKNLFKKNKHVNPGEIAKIAQLEKSKVDILRGLF
ncbi:CotS family spore coat protein [Marinisporobacter balticus]|uniref:Spore coat protein I n=1 Tax=Marinisporobacter balticus TaxID=2018667 RepID=A0A4V2SAB4_9FIRM|nr:CotS family spore coat protein [Marinisporobacter balticus]TCO71030.1 spore coat protein I [Marinisporobacter balticus]